MSKIDTVIISGGLGSSQMDDLAIACRNTGLRVIETPHWNGYEHIAETIENATGVGKLAIVGHSYASINGINAAAEYRAEYLCLIDPVGKDTPVYSLPSGGILSDWFVAEPTPFIVRLQIPNAIQVFPQLIPGCSHNEAPHNSAMIVVIIDHIKKSFGVTV